MTLGAGGMDFIPSKTHDCLNGLPFRPELVTGSAMVNPHFRGVTVADGTLVVVDSGAFQKEDMLNRKTPEEALGRQSRLMADLAYGKPQSRFVLVTYDMLRGVDEVIENGQRIKRRGNEETAREAVAETLKSAAYYASQRDRIHGAKIAFSAQGATPRQYVEDCVTPMLDMMKAGDWFAFGGFCIVGMNKSLLPVFVETIDRTLPLLRRRGIERAHILGVCWHVAIEEAAALGRKHGVQMSTDSSALEIQSVHGKVWDVRHMAETRTGTPWKHVYQKEHKKSDGPVSYHPCTLALENIARYHAWSQGLAGGARALPPVPVRRAPIQQELFNAA